MMEYTLITKTKSYSLIFFWDDECGTNYDALSYHYGPPVREEHHMYPMIDGSALCLRL